MVPVIAMMALQNGPTPVPAESKQFDFWVGEWNAKGKSAGANNTWQDTTATNSIKRVMGGHAVQESFKMGQFVGSSWSVYDPGHKVWKQTWVDNQGGYIDLVGGFEDGKMTLTTLPDNVHPKARNRMVFSNITAKEFDWDWEGSRDSGETWKLQWHLHYTRK